MWLPPLPPTGPTPPAHPHPRKTRTWTHIIHSNDKQLACLYQAADRVGLAGRKKKGKVRKTASMASVGSTGSVPGTPTGASAAAQHALAPPPPPGPFVLRWEADAARDAAWLAEYKQARRERYGAAGATTRMQL